jgi:hypothetical protein
MELTERILQGLKGYLGITVTHPDIAGEMTVTGITNDPVDFGWVGMPEAMRVRGRRAYCCRAATADPIFVFVDEATVTNAPADIVVQAMLDMIADIESENALTPYDVVDILQGRSISPDEWDEEE